MLKNAYLLAKIGADTAENEPVTQHVDFENRKVGSQGSIFIARRYVKSRGDVTHPPTHKERGDGRRRLALQSRRLLGLCLQT